MAASRSFKIILLGDVMLGRLIDQLLPRHVHEPSDANHAALIRKGQSFLGSYGIASPWGSTLALLESADLRLLNLETSITTHAHAWPSKTFNFRMHPANVDVLKAAKIDFASLANNHVLDFCEDGLAETVAVLKRAGISLAGAGDSRDEARRPAILELPNERNGTASERLKHKLHVFAASDHPDIWSGIDNFHLIQYDHSTRKRLKDLAETWEEQRQQVHKNESPPLRIFSLHWGPNYSWQPSPEIRSLAHFLVDECGIDIVYGHSAHHVQGVELYRGKLILYGCGDFVDDYAVSEAYRNDPGCVWQVVLEEYHDDGRGTEEEAHHSLTMKQLEIFPTKISNFKANLLEPSDDDHQWTRSVLTSLCHELGTQVCPDLGSQGQIVIKI